MSNSDAPMLPTEAEIVAMARRYAGWFCRSRRLGADWREDVEQEVASTLVRAATRFDPALNVSFARFARLAMHGAAIRALISRGGVPQSAWRRGCRPPRAFGEGEEPADRCRAAEAPAADLVAARAAIDSLPPLAQRVLRSHLEDGRSTASISRLLHLTHAQVNQILRDATNACRRFIRLARSEERIPMPASPAALPSTQAVAHSTSYAAIFLEVFDASLFRSILVQTRDDCLAHPELATRRARDALQFTELYERVVRIARADVFVGDGRGNADQPQLFPSPAARDRPAANA